MKIYIEISVYENGKEIWMKKKNKDVKNKKNREKEFQDNKCQLLKYWTYC